MLYSGTCGNALYLSLSKDSSVPYIVLMRYLPFKHNRYNFHIKVQVSWKTPALLDSLVVKNAQASELDVLRIIIIRKRKKHVTLQPSEILKMPGFRRNDSYYKETPFSLSPVIIQIIE